MKKKTIIYMLVLCCTMLPVMAGGPKFYYDYSRGYKGEAYAFFKNKTASIYDETLLREIFDNYERKMQELYGWVRVRGDIKITKEDSFLLWSALNEYDLSTGEIYVVYVYPENKLVESLIFLSVMITDNGNNCKYFASEWFN
ncbi:MAG: hypothetical protein J6R67_00140 [Treponema sp.]|nr:hypothetical protein [Treponema sp.]